MYKIGELSKLCKIPVKTLRFYSNEGILLPDMVDPYTGYRYYSASKLSDCYKILALKELGFSLEEIKEQFTMPETKLSGLLAAKEAELNTIKEQTEQRLKIIQQLSASLKEQNPLFHIIVKKDEDLRIAYKRLIIKNKSAIPEILDNIRHSLPAEIIGTRTVVIDYETEFQEECFDMGLGVEITGKLSAQDNLSEKTIRFTNETANLICRKDKVREAFLSLTRYLHEKPFQITGAAYEITYEDGTVELKIPVQRLLSQASSPRNDDLNLPFENDPCVIGRWKLVDVLPSREQFHPLKPKTTLSEKYAKELYFLPGGEWYWCYGWTKGFLLTEYGDGEEKGLNPYTIEENAQGTCLFVEMKSSAYFLYGGKPEIWVYKKLDSREYRRDEIRIHDDIPDLPADDSAILGNWETIGLIQSPEYFRPDSPRTYPYCTPYWQSAEFLPGGAMTIRIIQKDGVIHKEYADILRWVNGKVICASQSTVSTCFLKKYDNEEYLFLQWKNGDYIFGGRAPEWFVFRRI